MGTTPAMRQFAQLERSVRPGVEAAQRAFDRLFAPAQLKLAPASETLPATLPGEGPALLVTFDVYGPAKLRLAVLAPSQSAERLASVLLRRPGGVLDDVARGAFTELGNIIASAFLNGIAARTRLTLIPSVPRLDEERTARLVASFAQGVQILAVPFDSTLARGPVAGLVLVAPEPGTLDVLARAAT